MRRTTWYTRCPYCWERLALTDYDDPDVVIVLHAKKHNVKRPAWWSEGE